MRKSESCVTVGGQNGTAELVDPATSAADHEYGWMRTGARGQEERPDDSSSADRVACNPRSGNMAFERHLCAHHLATCRIDLNGKGPHDRFDRNGL